MSHYFPCPCLSKQEPHSWNGDRKSPQCLWESSQAEDKPAMILELNISMEAPNITMPRSSDSRDAIEVDLGSLRLGNAVAWRNGNSMKSPDVSTNSSSLKPLCVEWAVPLEFWSLVNNHVVLENSGQAYDFLACCLLGRPMFFPVRSAVARCDMF